MVVVWNLIAEIVIEKRVGGCKMLTSSAEADRDTLLILLGMGL